jgi:hypothetical protein
LGLDRFDVAVALNMALIAADSKVLANEAALSAVKTNIV